MEKYLENFSNIPLSPGACLREAASAKAGERDGVRGESFSWFEGDPPWPWGIIVNAINKLTFASCHCERSEAIS